MIEQSREANLKHLTSKLKFYDRVKEWSKNCYYSTGNEENEKETAAKGKLNTCNEIQDKIDEIVNLLCHVSTEKEGAHDDAYQVLSYRTEGESVEEDGDDVYALFNKAVCHFLYYWLGDLVWNSGDGHSVTDGKKFLDVMKQIYEALSEFNVNDNCKLLYADTDTNIFTKELFSRWKAIFDFTFDYKDIKTKLNHFSDSCDEKYYQHLKSAFDAFDAINKYCKDKNNDQYCQEFKGKYETSDGKKNPLTLTGSGPHEIGETEPKDKVYKDIKLELEYTKQYKQKLTAEKANRKAARGDGAGGRQRGPPAPPSAALTQGDPYLSGLHSKGMYETFDGGLNKCTKYGIQANNVKGKLETALGQYPDAKSKLEAIMDAWCYINKGMVLMDPSYRWRCDFFYYWVGEMLWEGSNAGTSFYSTMQQIYTALKELKDLGGSKVESMCEPMDKRVDQALFKQRKKLCDHSRDYNAFQTRLRAYGNSCSETFQKYLEGIFLTYDTVKRECGGKTDDYCKNFQSTYGPYCSGELANLSCSAGISTAAAVISSILGIVGLPVTTFFLYKYDRLPSGIRQLLGKSSNNNRRSGRSVRSAFDTFTEDSSTYGSTIGDSTIGSTVADNSTIYNGRRRSRQPPRKDGRSTNRAEQRSQRNNIHYHSMQR